MRAFANPAKRRLQSGDLSLGFILRQARTADIALIGKTCGFDWFSVDMEHSAIDVDTAAQIVGAALTVGIAPLVRVPSPLYPNATRLLDAGAQGLIIPHIDTPEEAAIAISYSRYPPLGRRSIASVQPQLAYEAVPGLEAMMLVDAEMLTVLMLETPVAVSNARSIASVPGVDVLLIGSNDLAAEMGLPGQVTHPAMETACLEVVEACRDSGKFSGVSGIHDREFLKKLIDAGLRFVGGGTDLAFLMQAAKDRANTLRNLLVEREVT